MPPVETFVFNHPSQLFPSGQVHLDPSTIFLLHSQGLLGCLSHLFLLLTPNQWLLQFHQFHQSLILYDLILQSRLNTILGELSRTNYLFASWSSLLEEKIKIGFLLKLWYSFSSFSIVVQFSGHVSFNHLDCVPVCSLTCKDWSNEVWSLFSSLF